MSIGTGIFCGLACLAIVYLFSQTKDRWKWKSITKYAAFVVLAPVVVAALWMGYTVARDYLLARPTPVTKYYDISLGDTYQEVFYAKGGPTNVLESSPTDSHLRYEVNPLQLPADKSVTDYVYWSYESADAGRLDIDFSPTSRKVIRVSCYSSPGSPCPSLLGVSYNDNRDAVISHLGSPDKLKPSDILDPTEKLRYGKLNVTFYLARRLVYDVEVDARDSTLVESKTSAMKSLPIECSLAQSANDCADILKKAGKNPFDAFDFGGPWPQSTNSAGSNDPKISAH